MGHGPFSLARDLSPGDGSRVPEWVTRSWQFIEVANRGGPRNALSCYETALKLPPGAFQVAT